eukprot:comp19737_c0_seq1/m.23536 comp19737_c0_seq1/g.23536  ORF comp19737_c0_seq1/g.23536 comp19737_c0_seq1/m.23536 type:complete len:680 (-) comp19737_c0_seq1:81-2120(-)
MDNNSSSVSSGEGSDTDIELEDIRGSDVIVIQPGSSFLRIGFAKDVFPTTIPHRIARRLRVAPAPHTEQEEGEDMDLDKIDLDGFRDADWEDVMADTVAGLDFAQKNRKGGVKKKDRAANTGAALTYNETVQGEKIPAHLDHTEVQWRSIGDREFLVGDEISTLRPADNVKVFHPIRKGLLNVQPIRGIEAVKSDLCDIWAAAIKKHLHVSRHRLNEYRAVVLVPDQYLRSHVRALVEVLLEDMGFAACLVHQESVCATFGAGMTSACLVDVGAQKVSVCCVDEGLSVPSSRITVNYGGDDITRLFYWLLKKISFPYKACESGDHLDWSLLNSLKEQHCSLLEDEPTTGKPTEFIVRRPDQLALKYTMRLADEPCRAPSALFVPNLLGRQPYVAEIINRTTLDNEHDPSEIVDDAMLIEREAGVYLYGFKVFAGRVPAGPSPVPNAEDGGVVTKTGMPNGADENMMCRWIGCTLKYPDLTTLLTHVMEDHVGRKQSSYVCGWEGCQRSGRPFPHKPAITAHMRTHVPVFLDKSTLPQSTAPTPTPGRETPQPQPLLPEEEIIEGSLSIDEAINLSISRSGGEDFQRRMYDSIMLCGGGHLYRGFAAYLEKQQRASMPPELRDTKIQILENPRDMDPRILSWKGASILARLDYADDYWITAEEWRDQGVNILRDCLPFVY